MRIAKYGQSLIAVILPVIAVAILNVSLVYFLRKRRRILNNSTNNCDGDLNEFKEQEFRYLLNNWIYSIITHQMSDLKLYLF